MFNADETRHFFLYKCTLDQTIALKGNLCSKGKQKGTYCSHQVNGTEKLPLLVTDKLAHPQCLKKVKANPVQYEANKKDLDVGV